MTVYFANANGDGLIGINTIIGEKFRSLRESQGYSQADFAEECQISRAYYGRIERGEYNVTLYLCERISKTLGISLSELFRNV